MITVELVDPWHEPGYRVEIPDGPWERMVTVAVDLDDDRVDPATGRRLGDVETGEYTLLETDAADGTPRYQWAGHAAEKSGP